MEIGPRGPRRPPGGLETKNEWLGLIWQILAESHMRLEVRARLCAKRSEVLDPKLGPDFESRLSRPKLIQNCSITCT